MSKRRNNNGKRKGNRRGRRNQIVSDNMLSLPNTSSTWRTNNLVIPDRVFTNLSYDFGGYNIQSSTTGSLLVAGNSVYDPDKTGTGHQPMGFLQWIAFFSRYRVHYSTIVVTLLQATSQCSISVVPTIDSSVPSNFQNSVESPYVKYRNVSSSVFKCSIKSKLWTKKLWGFQNINQDDLFSANTGTDPSRLWYWKILTASYDLSTSCTIWLNVRVVYHVEFFGRSNLTPSLDEFVDLNKTDLPEEEETYPEKDDDINTLSFLLKQLIHNVAELKLMFQE
jgi:hypothetical protein